MASLAAAVLALGAQGCGGCPVGLCGCVEIGAEGFQNLVAVFHFRQFVGYIFGEGDDLGDGVSVLALEAVEQGEAVFDLGQPLRARR